jgi:hypothetical protein
MGLPLAERSAEADFRLPAIPLVEQLVGTDFLPSIILLVEQLAGTDLWPLAIPQNSHQQTTILRQNVQ